MNRDAEFARELWKRLETIHAVTYFAPESHAAAKAAGLRGFWMGYFGFRGAPLGAVSAGVIEAAFANFAPTMVRRSIPDAWSYARPGDLVHARAEAAAGVLRSVSSFAEIAASSVNEELGRAIAGGTSIGRPLFAANRDLAERRDPVEQLWQHCTTLREHRGDGHVAALAAARIDGCQAHILLAADRDLPPEVFFDNRGWTDAQRSVAAQRLVQRGLLDDDGFITRLGREERAAVEHTTDMLASEPFDHLTASDRSGLVSDLTAIATDVVASGILPFPNPMGLERLDS